MHYGVVPPWIMAPSSSFVGTPFVLTMPAHSHGKLHDFLNADHSVGY